MAWMAKWKNSIQGTTMSAFKLASQMIADANRAPQQHGSPIRWPAVGVPFAQKALVLFSRFHHAITSLRVIEDGASSKAHFAARDVACTNRQWMARFSSDGVPFHFLLTNHTPLPLTFQLDKVEKGETLTVNKINILHPFQTLKLDTDNATQTTFVFTSVKGRGGGTQSVRFGDTTGNSEATQFRLQVSNARDVKRRVSKDIELALCSSDEGSTRWECVTGANMLNLNVPPLKKRRGGHSPDGDKVGYGAHGREDADGDDSWEDDCAEGYSDDSWEDDCGSDEEEDDSASVEDDVLGKLTKGKLNIVETVVNNDIRSLKGTQSPVCRFGFSLIG